MSAVSPALLRFAASPPIHRPHQVAAMTAASFNKLLTPGERWFLCVAAKLPRLSEQQQARLTALAVKVERTRR